MKFDHLKGSVVAMVTPFHEDGSVNFDVLTQLLERQITAGTDAILTLGTTGEYSTMTHEEDAAVVAHTIKVVNGRVPVMVGSGSNCTATQIEKSIEYQNMGADALLLIAPYYNKANAEGMYRHFAQTADAVDIPCILYNVPGRTGCSIPVSVVERLCSASQGEIGNAWAVDNAVSIVTADAKIYIQMDELVDKEAEIARLNKELQSAEKQFATATAKLHNEKFISKAPANVVEGVRQNAAKLEEHIALIRSSLEALNR